MLVLTNVCCFHTAVWWKSSGDTIALESSKVDPQNEGDNRLGLLFLLLSLLFTETRELTNCNCNVQFIKTLLFVRRVDDDHQIILLVGA